MSSKVFLRKNIFVFRKKSGFTLVELMIAIAILGILTMITVGQFSTAQKRARDVARKSDLNSLSKALLSFYVDYDKFPSVNDLLKPVDINSMWGGAFNDNGYAYMSRMPKENKTGYPQYCYVVSADQKSFALFAMLEETGDKDCKLNSEKSGLYTHCNGGKYCFSITSPNASVNDFEGL